MSWIWQRNPHSHPLCSLSSSILPFLSSLESGHAPTFLRSSAAVFGKINGVKEKVRSWERQVVELKGRSVDVSAAVAWPFALLTNRGMQSTHRHTLCPPLRERTGATMCVSDPGNGRNAEGQCHSSRRSTCLSSHTAVRRLWNVWRLSIHRPMYVSATHKHPHTAHVNCMLSISNHICRQSHFVP